MRKHVEESVATGALTPPGAAVGVGSRAGRKREVVMRLLRGEDLESVSRAVRHLGITAARARRTRPRAQFLAAGQAGLKSRATDARRRSVEMRKHVEESVDRRGRRARPWGSVLGRAQA